jgi:inosine-uridine nucleoside N-ribohydrolase
LQTSSGKNKYSKLSIFQIKKKKRMIFYIVSVIALTLALASTHAAAQSVVVDVSGTVGDLLTLEALNRQSGTTIRLVTVNGNTAATAAAAATNVRAFLTWLGRSDIPVAVGATTAWKDRDPLACNGNRFLAPGSPEQTGLASGRTLSSWGQLWNRFSYDTIFGLADALPQPAVQWKSTDTTATTQLRGILSASSRQVDYIALGSLTNLADFLQDAVSNGGALLSQLGVIHINGGSVAAQEGLAADFTGWPMDAKAEWNFAADPDAANYVLSSDAVRSLQRQVYTADLTASVYFDRTTWAVMTTEALDRAMTLAASTSATERALAPIMQWGAVALAASKARASSDAVFFSRYFPKELFVGLAATDRAVQAIISSTQRSVTVSDAGVMTATTVSASDMTYPFVFSEAPASAAPFWDRCFTLLNLQ